MSWSTPIEYVIRGLGSIMYVYCILYIYIPTYIIAYRHTTYCLDDLKKCNCLYSFVQIDKLWRR